MARRRRRPRRGEQYWQDAIERLERSRLSAVELCRVEEIRSSILSYWRRKLGESRASAVSLVPVQVSDGFAPGWSVACFEVLVCSGRALRAPPGFDRRSLRDLVALLEEENAC